MPPLDRFTLRDVVHLQEHTGALAVAKVVRTRVLAVAVLRLHPGHLEVDLLARDRAAPRGTGLEMMLLVERYILPSTGRPEVRLDAVGRVLMERFYAPLGYAQVAPAYRDPDWPEPLFPMRKRVP